MEIAPTLKNQEIQNSVREVGINPNYWYPVAWADQLKFSQVISVVVWQQEIAIYRDRNGQLYGLEDACPHKGVQRRYVEINPAIIALGRVIIGQYEKFIAQGQRREGIGY